MKYQVVRTCYHNNRLYTQGDVVTLEGSVPDHFLPLPDLEDMSVAELKKKAGDMGLTIKTNKKADIIAAIRGE